MYRVITFGEIMLRLAPNGNYRSRLWSRVNTSAVMKQLCRYVDICIANEEDAKDVFGIEADNTDIYNGRLDRKGYQSVAKQLADKFDFKKVAITLRTSISASDNDWSEILYDGNDFYCSKEYHVHIIDRGGGGDSISAGLIYVLLKGKRSQETIDFAVAASALKHSVEEVEKLAGGDG